MSDINFVPNHWGWSNIMSINFDFDWLESLNLSPFQLQLMMIADGWWWLMMIDDDEVRNQCECDWPKCPRENSSSATSSSPFSNSFLSPVKWNICTTFYFLLLFFLINLINKDPATVVTICPHIMALIKESRQLWMGGEARAVTKCLLYFRFWNYFWRRCLFKDIEYGVSSCSSCICTFRPFFADK